jgi:O-antigen ligase
MTTADAIVLPRGAEGGAPLAEDPTTVTISRWVPVSMVALVLSTMLPQTVGLVVQVSALLVPVFLYLGRTERIAQSVTTLVCIVCVYWVLLAFHPNVPNLFTGLLGVRLAVLALGGLVFGLAFTGRDPARVERIIVTTLVLALAVSIAVFLVNPQFNFGIERAAGFWTAQFQGRARLQGVFAGPFHVAMAASTLVAWAMFRWRLHRFLAASALLVGLVAGYLTAIRSVYPAVAVAVIAFVMQSSAISTRAKRVVSLVVAAFAVIVISGQTDNQVLGVIDTIFNASEDTRLTGRFVGYGLGLEMVGRSPVFGWGAGSAGDGLAGNFSASEHLTSHNFFLMTAIEGGITGLLLWVALICAIVVWLVRSNQTAFGLAVLGIFIVFGLTGSAIAALPVTWYMFALVGLAIATRDSPDQVAMPADVEGVRDD